MSRRRILLVVAAAILPVLGYAGWAAYVRFSGPNVQTDTFVGWNEARLRASFGEPGKDWQGYQPLALYTPPSLPAGPIRTLIFDSRGFLHPEGGTLWAWVVERNGEWVCFESCWFANGTVF